MVVDLQEKDAVELAPSSPGYYSRLFVTPKVTGGWRPAIDLSRLNRSVDVSHFYMETSQSVLQYLRPGYWMVSLDLQDAYLQVLLHPSSHHYLRFCVGDAVLQFRSLCFSLSSFNGSADIYPCHGPGLLANASLRLQDPPVLERLARPRILIPGDCAGEGLIWLCQELGICINIAKSSLTPFQSIDYLGMRVFPTPKRVLKHSSLMHEFIFCRQHLPFWRQLLGVMSSMSSLVPGSRLRMRSLQLRLYAAGRSLVDTAVVSWDDSCLKDLGWWSVESNVLVCLPLGLPQPDLLLFTDTLDTGWGASVEDSHLSGLWPPGCSQYSINHRELLVVLYAV